MTAIRAWMNMPMIASAGRSTPMTPAIPRARVLQGGAPRVFAPVTQGGA